MAARIVLFGATGYTGRLTAESLVAAGAKPVLAARGKQRLRELASELGGGLETEVADVARPASVRALVEKGDILLTTVGPFLAFGEPAVEAAIAAGADYIDSTGEAPFIRRVFQDFGPRAQAAGCALVTALGYDWVPGNLAGALALRDAGEAAERVDIGYYFVGDGGGMSGGTRASAILSGTEPAHGLRDGRLVTERGGRRLRSFEVRGEERQAVSVGSSEHFALPRVHASLREVNVYLGWFGPLSRAMQGASALTAGIAALPLAGGLMRGGLRRLTGGSTGGPDEAARARTGSYVVAIAYDGDGRRLAECRLQGPNGYTFTADMLSWGARRAAAGGLAGKGALGPVDGFGLDELEAGVKSCGFKRV